MQCMRNAHIAQLRTNCSATVMTTTMAVVSVAEYADIFWFPIGNVARGTTAWIIKFVEILERLHFWPKAQHHRKVPQADRHRGLFWPKL